MAHIIKNDSASQRQSRQHIREVLSSPVRRMIPVHRDQVKTLMWMSREIRGEGFAGAAVYEVPAPDVSDPIEFGSNERRPRIVHPSVILYPHIEHDQIASRRSASDRTDAPTSAHPDFEIIARLYMSGENQQYGDDVPISPIFAKPPQPVGIEILQICRIVIWGERSQQGICFCHGFRAQDLVAQCSRTDHHRWIPVSHSGGRGVDQASRSIGHFGVSRLEAAPGFRRSCRGSVTALTGWHAFWWS